MISREIFLEILERSKIEKSTIKIARDLNLSESVVYYWIKKGKYRESRTFNCNVKHFETLSNTQISCRFDIHINEVIKLRKKLAPHTSRFEKYKIQKEFLYSKILEYIKNNKFIKIKDFLEKFKYKRSNSGFGGNSIRKIFQEIANKNSIEIIFYTSRHPNSKLSKRPAKRRANDNKIS